MPNNSSRKSQRATPFAREEATAVARKKVEEKLCETSLPQPPTQKATTVITTAHHRKGGFLPLNPDESRLDAQALRAALEVGALICWRLDLRTNEMACEPPRNLLFAASGADAPYTFKDFIARIHSDDREKITREFKMARITREPLRAEFRTFDAEGKMRWVAVKGHVCRHEPNAAAEMIGILQDITAEKRAAEEREELLENERRARLTAEQANHAKDELLSSVSHELRAPLAAIVGWAGILRSGKLGKKESEKALLTIERNALVQRTLIDELLDASRAVSGRLTVKKESVDLCDIVENVVRTFKDSADAKGIKINLSIEAKSLPMTGDPERLHQVIVHLLSNAVKFTPEGGRIDVHVSTENAHARVRISDTGIGIKSELLPHVFERFRQPEAPLGARWGGLGLGLIIARSLIELHDGTLEAYSAGENKGATFTVILPLNAELLTNHESDESSIKSTAKSTSAPHLTATPFFEKDASEGDLAQLKVLVVDDDEATREIFEFVLTQLNAKVCACASAFDALRALEEWHPDALICDIGMPGMDGYELIRRVRALPLERGGAIPAVAVTAYTRPEDRARALQAGFQMHVAKPVAPDELAAAVTTLVSAYSPATRFVATVKELNEKEVSAPAIGRRANSVAERSATAAGEAQVSLLSEAREKATRNYLLAALPNSEFERLLPHMELVKLNVSDILSQPDDAIRNVYFPTSAVVSLLSITEDGASVEVGMVGREGMLGISIVLGFGQTPSWAMVTIGGEAIKINADALKRELQQNGALRDVLLNYTRTLITQISQTAVCNRRHSVDNRLCTWLLMIQDRVGRRNLALTQELIASRLGTRRAGISTSVKTLTENRIVRASRGKLRVLDREGLEAAACECYEIVKADYDKITQPTAGALA